jgi:hypothetical protein
VLVSSGAVTDRFLNEVDDLCTRLGGDAEALVAGLEAGRVPKFFRKNVEALRAYLEEKGYLDARDPRRPDAVAKELLVEAAQSITARRTAASEVARLLRRICAGSGVPMTDEVRKTPEIDVEPSFLPDLLAQ